MENNDFETVSQRIILHLKGYKFVHWIIKQRKFTSAQLCVTLGGERRKLVRKVQKKMEFVNITVLEF